MFNSNVLEVGIGLAFVYLLLGLVVSAANELVAAGLRSRATHLKQGIQNMLENGASTGVLSHALIKSLSPAGKSPSYLPPGLFAVALLDKFEVAADGDRASFEEIRQRIENISDVRVKEALRALLESARTDLTDGVAALDKLKAQIEQWYSSVMERVSGGYQRKTRLVLFGISLFAAVLLNLDTASISRKLSQNSTLRAALVAQATQFLGEHKDGTPAAPATLDAIKQSIKSIDELEIPLGWISGGVQEVWSGGAASITTKIGGLLITALAGSLGAPFWFDVLNKFIAVRGIGKSPEEHEEEKAK